MIKKTAMQEFIKWGDKMMRDYPMKELGFGQAIDKAIELLEMEKEQIIDAYKFGLTDEYVIGSDKYYNSTYGSKGSETKQSLYTKEQLREAFRGFASGKSFEQYYNETYGSNGSDETKQ